MKLKLRLSYLGTDFCGYQVQPGKPTVQGALNGAARSLFGCECDITGCSRTDSGVHANDFCVTVSKKGSDDIECSVPVDRIPEAMNVRLPESISVREASLVPSDFHPRYDVLYKEYVYLIYDSRIRDPFLSGRAYMHRRRISDEGVDAMNRAASYLLGEHDFASYMAAGSKVASSVRRMKHASVRREGQLIKITLAADGFLYNMVRIIAGTLLDVGEGRILPEEIKSITDACRRSSAGATLPPEGLFLNKVVYPEEE